MSRNLWANFSFFGNILSLNLWAIHLPRLLVCWLVGCYCWLFLSFTCCSAHVSSTVLVAFISSNCSTIGLLVSTVNSFESNLHQKVLFSSCNFSCETKFTFLWLCQNRICLGYAGLSEKVKKVMLKRIPKIYAVNYIIELANLLPQ